MFDFCERGQCADFNSLLSFVDAFEFRDAADVEYVFGLEKLLAHGGEEVGASCENASARVRAQEGDGVGEGAWAGELEVGEAHAKSLTTQNTEEHRGTQKI